MSHSCENCGQSILDSDIVCWHCGWQLAPSEAAADDAGPKEESSLAKQQFSFSAIAVYAGITFLVLILLLAVMSSLGDFPLTIANPDTSRIRSWMSVTGQQMDFTVSLPPRWQWLDKNDPEQTVEFIDTVTSKQQFTQAVEPFGSVGTQIEVLAVASGGLPEQPEAASGFVVVAEDVRSDQLTLEESLSLIQQSDIPARVLHAVVAEDLGGRSQGIFLIDMIVGGQEYRCQQRFIKAPQTVFLVAGCSERVRFPYYSGVLQNILDSFQPLVR